MIVLILIFVVSAFHLLASYQLYGALICYIQAIKAATDVESELPLLSGMSVTILEGDIHGLCLFDIH